MSTPRTDGNRDWKRCPFLSFLRLFLPHYTHTTPVQLPPGMPRETFDRMWAVGYDTDTAKWLAGFDLLTCTTFTGAGA